MRLIGLIVGAIVIAACSSGGEPSPTPAQTLQGTMTLSDGFTKSSFGLAATRFCEGEGGYDDMREGAQVTVRDGSDELIASGRLAEGEVVTGGCEFSFAVQDVPTAAFYTIEVSHRGGLAYSAAEMEAADWDVAFTLGD